MLHITRASHSAKNESSHASGAADTAENGPERAFLKENAKYRKGKCHETPSKVDFEGVFPSLLKGC